MSRTVKKLNNIFVSGNLDNNTVYLTSGIQPPNDSGSVLDQIKVHSEMQSYASGGSVYHMNLVDTISPDKKCNLIKSLFENFTIRYISLTPILSICQNCGMKMVGKQVNCKSCGSADISCWSRPVGYFRPAVRGNLSSDLKKSDYTYWLKSRIEELSNRKTIDQEIVNRLEGLGDILS